MIKIEDMGLSKRVCNNLLKEGIRTLDDLVEIGLYDLFMHKKGFGHKALSEIISKTKEYGIDMTNM